MRTKSLANPLSRSDGGSYDQVMNEIERVVTEHRRAEDDAKRAQRETDVAAFSRGKTLLGDFVEMMRKNEIRPAVYFTETEDREHRTRLIGGKVPTTSYAYGPGGMFWPVDSTGAAGVIAG